MEVDVHSTWTILVFALLVFGSMAETTLAIHSVNVTSGNQVILPCTHDGIRPNLKFLKSLDWYKVAEDVNKQLIQWRQTSLGTKLVNVHPKVKDRMDIFNLTSLRINNTQVADGGIYQCDIIYRGNLSHMSTVLNVIDIPTTVTDSHRKPPDIPASGYLTGGTIAGVSGTLFATIVLVFVCRKICQNKGQDEADFELHKLLDKIPGEPTSLDVRNTTLHTTTLTWKEPQAEEDRPVTGYALNIYQVTGTKEVLSETHKVAGGLREFIIKNMDPQKAYLFKLAAVNRFGPGPFASYTFISMIENIRQSYKSKLSSICLDPSNPEIKVPINSFYLSLQMLNINDQKHQIKDIGSYKEAFTQGDDPQRIALYGPAGAGKTVSCQVIAYFWAKDGVLAKQFDLVIFLALRGHKKSDDITEMIINQTLPNRRGEQGNIKKLIDEYSGRILFVLDGYDELLEESSVAEYDRKLYTVQDLLNHHSEALMVSTRPTQLGDLKLSAGINMKIRIKGFAEPQAICFIKNYCNARDITFLKDPSQPIEDVIIKQLKEKHLMSLSKNPQQLQMVCDYMRDHDETSASLTELFDDFYQTHMDYFLQKITKGPQHHVHSNQDIESHKDLFHQLLKLALWGFVHGRLIYKSDIYLRLLGEKFVKVYDKLGAVYFEEALGARHMVMGFRHKSHQEYFAAKYLFLCLIIQMADYPEEVVEAIEQWKDLKKAVRYERLFVFMAGMAKDERSARKVMGYIFEMIGLLPSYFHSEGVADVHDPEDIPRQLMLMQVKCALEMKAVNKCNSNEYIDQLLQALPYSGDTHPQM